MKEQQIQQSFDIAKARYAELGVDVEKAISELDKLPISLHCWQTDDVTGFEKADAMLTGGIQTTGNYLGKARNIKEVMADLEKALSLIPGNHRVNVHAIYGDFSAGFADRIKLNQNISKLGLIGPKRIIMDLTSIVLVFRTINRPMV
jgi:L-rhamnose isomerase